MLLSLVLNDDIEDDSLTAMYQIDEFIVQIKQRPSEGHIEHQEEKEVEEVSSFALMCYRAHNNVSISVL
jgi:hypothetical protein